MDNLELKVKLAVLWLAATIVMLVHIVLSLLEPGTVSQVIDGHLEGMALSPVQILLFTLVLLVPVVMAVLLFVLNDKINRLSNIIVSTVILALGLLDLFAHNSGQPRATAFIAIVTNVIPAVILYYAIRWKRK